MKIYTRSGDKGDTSLYTGQRVKKNDPLIDAIGTVDECNSAIGLSISLLPQLPEYKMHREHLELIQHALFDLGAALATPRTRATNSKIDRTRFDSHATELLEKWIDQMEQELPPLKTFILPGGHPAGSALHVARSICRRAERLVVPVNMHADVSDHVLVYLNRLSDYLFVMSRYINFMAKNPETLWVQHKVVEE
jgi:cob(I)alamin adenosyltransferase